MVRMRIVIRRMTAQTATQPTAMLVPVPVVAEEPGRSGGNT